MGIRRVVLTCCSDFRWLRGAEQGKICTAPDRGYQGKVDGATFQEGRMASGREGHGWDVTHLPARTREHVLSFAGSGLDGRIRYRLRLRAAPDRGLGRVGLGWGWAKLDGGGPSIKRIAIRPGGPESPNGGSHGCEKS